MYRKPNGRLFVAVAALIAGGAFATARAADDMAGMKTDKDSKETKAPATKPSAKTAPQKMEIAVTDKGFEPDKFTVKKGQPVEFVFTRTTDQTFIKEVVLDTGGTTKVQKPLPLNKPVVIKTKFIKAGDLKYACGMNMFSGTVTVQWSACRTPAPIAADFGSVLRRRRAMLRIHRNAPASNANVPSDSPGLCPQKGQAAAERSRIHRSASCEASACTAARILLPHTGRLAGKPFERGHVDPPGNPLQHSSLREAGATR